MENKNTLVAIVAKNIAHYRKQLNMTQLELAERLNYSDKSVSKWERAEGMPDIYVLKELSDFFGVRLDDLVSEHKFKPIAKKRKDFYGYFYASISIFLGILLYAILSLSVPSIDKWWLFIIGSLPCASLTLFVFNVVWKRLTFIYLYMTIFIWTISLLTFLLIKSVSKAYLVFIAAIPVYIFVMLLLFFIYKKR